MLKKFKYVLLLILTLIIPFVGVNAATTTTASSDKDPVKVYVFYGSTCDYCESLHTWLDELAKDDDYSSKYELVDLEVWNDEDNEDLMNNVAEYFDFNLKGVPFVVIGENYTTGYDESSTPDTIKKYIDEAYNDDDYEDIVAKVAGGEITATDESEETEENGSAMSTRVGYILLIVVGIIIIAIIYARVVENKEAKKDIGVELPKEKIEAKELKVKSTKVLDTNKKRKINTKKKSNNGKKATKSRKK